MNGHKSIPHHSMGISHRMVAHNLFKAIREHAAVFLLLQIDVRHLAMSLEVVRLARLDLIQNVHCVVHIAFL